MQELSLHIWQVTSCQEPVVVKVLWKIMEASWRMAQLVAHLAMGSAGDKTHLAFSFQLRPGDKCPEAAPQSFAARLSVV